MKRGLTIFCKNLFAKNNLRKFLYKTLCKNFSREITTIGFAPFSKASHLLVVELGGHGGVAGHAPDPLAVHRDPLLLLLLVVDMVQVLEAPAPVLLVHRAKHLALTQVLEASLLLLLLLLEVQVLVLDLAVHVGGLVAMVMLAMVVLVVVEAKVPVKGSDGVRRPPWSGLAART